METRVIVCGSRGFTDKTFCFSQLDTILSEYRNLEIVSGHARGTDLFAEEYASLHGLKLSVFSPDWKKYGRGAGPIRNRQMLEYALEAIPLVVAFWNGESRGTKNMIMQAQKARVEVRIFNF